LSLARFGKRVMHKASTLCRDITGLRNWATREPLGGHDYVAACLYACRALVSSIPCNKHGEAVKDSRMSRNMKHKMTSRRTAYYGSCEPTSLADSPLITDQLLLGLGLSEYAVADVYILHDSQSVTNRRASPKHA
jgi:hypothetical protein